MLMNILKGFFRLSQRNKGTMWKLFITALNILLFFIFWTKYIEAQDTDETRGAITIPHDFSSSSSSTLSLSSNSFSSIQPSSIAGNNFSSVSSTSNQNSPVENSTPREGANRPEKISAKVIYLDQGWSNSDSLWFYNTTQGSDLLPYDFFMALEQAGSTTLFRDNQNIDNYRYLPQKPTLSNPDGLPVGFVKDTYQGKDYVGFTCAACHTGQIDYNNIAIRIDGGPAMADMNGLLIGIQKSLSATLEDKNKHGRFIKNIIERKENYSTPNEVDADLKKWAAKINFYNTVNQNHIGYGYGRLDLIGITYNKILQYSISKEQLDFALATITTPYGERLLTEQQINKVLDSVNSTIINDEQFALILERLTSKNEGYPALSIRDILRVRNAIFNEVSAPVSYPALWNSPRFDYTFWSGLVSNKDNSPLERNIIKLIGTFATLDWQTDNRIHNLFNDIATTKNNIDFKSSINMTNMVRLENKLLSLKSPAWPEAILGHIDLQKAQRGQLTYKTYCESCHSLVDNNNWAQFIPVKMINIDVVGTDPVNLFNINNYAAYSSNFEGRYLINNTTINIAEKSLLQNLLPVVTLSTMATPDADKNFLHKVFDWSFLFFEPSKNFMIGNSDRPAALSYKATPLSGIWATAPYLHNGSVPNLYSLLLPQRREGDPTEDHRPDTFCVGSRQFDPMNVGLISNDCNINDSKDKKRFSVEQLGNQNSGHEYGTGRDEKAALTVSERWDLIEYLKTL